MIKIIDPEPGQSRLYVALGTRCPVCDEKAQANYRVRDQEEMQCLQCGSVHTRRIGSGDPWEYVGTLYPWRPMKS